MTEEELDELQADAALAEDRELRLARRREAEEKGWTDRDDLDPPAWVDQDGVSRLDEHGRPL